MTRDFAAIPAVRNQIAQAEARKCTATTCPLWPFRMGRNPFRGRAK